MKAREERQKETFNNAYLLENSKENINMQVQITSGSLRKRKDGLFEIRYYQNKQRFSVYGHTKQEVITKYQKAITKKRTIKKKVKTKTLEVWLKEWLELFKKPKLSKNSLRIINNNLKNYILPSSMAKINLNEITTSHIQKFLNKIPYDRTREMVATTLKDSFNKAFITNLIKTNPFLGVEVKKANSKSWKALTIQEQKIFINEIKGHILEPFFKFCLLTGARRSGALNFKWQNIDKEKGFIYLFEPKTKKTRPIPLTKELEEQVFNKIKKSNDYLFNYSSDYVTKGFRKIRDKLGFSKQIVLHSLRHTLVTRLSEAKVRPEVSKEISGHSSFELHYNTYTDINNERIKEEYKKVIKNLL